MGEVKIRRELEPVIDQLLTKRRVVADDPAITREVARAMSGLRRDGRLVIAHDEKHRKTYMWMNNVRKKRKKRSLRRTTFELDVF